MKLLLLEDHDDLARAVCAHLRAAHHEVTHCRRAVEADLLLNQPAGPPQLVLLDLQLPDADGLVLLRRWREQGHTQPVIVLTARDQVSDRVRGLQAGADDYLVKPFDLDELLARVDAVARRGLPPPARVVGRLALDAAGRSVSCDGQAHTLTRMEWEVLACLARQPGRICPRSTIELRLADAGVGDPSSNSLEVIISRLRKKLGADTISTHRGLGYRLDG